MTDYAGNSHASAPEEPVIEHFLPWIQKIMLAYEIKSTDETDPFPPEGIKLSKGYYTKKVN
ncbi:hypothetical protein A3D77_01990 [Candidatus Gottesmanbacteria bacterium RIFCSPHIGHO2_02_FULL_39_11]|uniref:Uncharacterized protein n=1 Tax=Candidatus Gottesmanbacteria bacterium RIFCSPHIGHO2_02_FULL_39_11 TaxID=1798382 RepID=A0A1F5ZUP3_9BACT|nr:MAG: hypothetical protein A3D77_01990 [Candidatus Gottesmanbacteria bacterium RIFCSPHIGHO2_02_FULL_39_11]